VLARSERFELPTLRFEGAIKNDKPVRTVQLSALGDKLLLATVPISLFGLVFEQRERNDEMRLPCFRKCTVNPPESIGIAWTIEEPGEEAPNIAVILVSRT
jgi:hypothetical protein